MLSYVPAFEDDYGVFFVDVSTIDIVEYVIPTNFLATSSRRTQT